MSDHIQLQIRTAEPQRLTLKTENGSANLSLGNSIPVPETDYNRLRNKPRLDGVELMGDISMQQVLRDMLEEGIILDGGTAEDGDDG